VGSLSPSINFAQAFPTAEKGKQVRNKVLLNYYLFFKINEVKNIAKARSKLENLHKKGANPK
jgi:hypothetical protein